MRYELNDTALGLVSAGTYSQTADDSRFLNSLNGSTDRYGTFKIFIDSGKRTSEIESAWLALEIFCDTSDGENTYSLGGGTITQEEARRIAMERTGRRMTESDWKW